MLTKDDISQIQKVVRHEVNPIKKDVKTLINYFDRENTEIKRRVKTLERNLELSA